MILESWRGDGGYERTEAKIMATRVPIEHEAQMDLPFIPGMNRASIEQRQTEEGGSSWTRKHAHGRLIYADVYCHYQQTRESRPAFISSKAIILV